MAGHEELDDDWDWHEFNQFMKQRWREHVARNIEDYKKYQLFMTEQLGASETTQGSGFRYTFSSNLRIDFWPQAGKWTHVGTNKYQQGPKKMLRYIKAHLGRQVSTTVNPDIATEVYQPKFKRPEGWADTPLPENIPPWNP